MNAIAGAVPVFLYLFLLMGLGRALTRLEAMPPRSADVLNLVALYVCLPAAVALYVPRLNLDASVLGLVAVPWLILLCSAAIVQLLSRLMGLTRGVTGVLMITIPLGNTSYLGFPLTVALLGPDALAYAVIYDQLGSFCILSTYGLLIVSLYSGKERPSALGVLRRMFTFPAFIALLAGLWLLPEQYPPAVEQALSQLTGALMPLAALSIGMQMQLRMPRHLLGPLGLGLGLKLLAMPALAILICSLLGLTGQMRATAILETAMPTMVSAAALAALARLEPALATAMAGYGVVFMALTIPFWLLVAG